MIRLFHWEYWPVYVANFPVFFFWLFHAIRARDVFFFSAVNPAIATGGFFGEEKHKIYDLIPSEFLPRTLFIASSELSHDELEGQIEKAGMTYPLVGKPDIGERGMHVRVVHNVQELHAHVQSIEGGVIIQEYISHPLELSVLCYRFPFSGRSDVTSICRKVFLSVLGDGQSTLRQLIDQYPRAILQKRALARRMDLEQVPASGESVLLEPIGNHCRGTQFLNANDWITPELEKTIISVLARMPGVYYGRFDLRTKSIEDLSAGREFQIMEFNGVGSEPAHVYDPSYPLLQGYRDFWNHWRTIYQISREQKAHGVHTMHWREGLDSLRSYFIYKRKANLTAGT